MARSQSIKDSWPEELAVPEAEGPTASGWTAQVVYNNPCSNIYSVIEVGMDRKAANSADKFRPGFTIGLGEISTLNTSSAGIPRVHSKGRNTDKFSLAGNKLSGSFKTPFTKLFSFFPDRYP